MSEAKAAYGLAEVVRLTGLVEPHFTKRFVEDDWLLERPGVAR